MSIITHPSVPITSADILDGTIVGADIAAAAIAQGAGKIGSLVMNAGFSAITGAQALTTTPTYLTGMTASFTVVGSNAIMLAISNIDFELAAGGGSFCFFPFYIDGTALTNGYPVSVTVGERFPVVQSVITPVAAGTRTLRTYGYKSVAAGTVNAQIYCTQTVMIFDP